MALISVGYTKCAVCLKVLEEGEDIIGMAHFIDDWRDPLYRFSDSAMREACYETWALRGEWEARYRQHVEKCRRSNERWLNP